MTGANGDERLCSLYLQEIQKMFATSLNVLALAAIAGSAPELKVDPLMVAAAGEVWNVIAKPDNPVWPGWNAADTPILIYLPNVQEVLINHPQRPADFAAYSGPVASPAGPIFVRDGKTLIDFDGQNTSREVFNVQTLVIADTLSSRKQEVEYWLTDSRPVEDRIKELTYDRLRPNPYDILALVAHEAFHVYQNRKAPNKGGNEMALAKYPVLSVTNNVGWALEGEALAAALRAESKPEIRKAAIRWLAVRKDRRADMPAEAVQYEDGTEFNEGLAKYVEYKLFQVLEGRKAGNAMFHAQGFRGFDDLSAERGRLVDTMLSNMRGEVNVNNDPYGAAPVRMRMYFSGMAIAAILDKVSPGWHAKILEAGTTLAGLAEAALAPNATELAEALSQAKSATGYPELVQRKERLAEEGRGFVARMVAEVEKSPHGLLVVDYSALGNPRVSLAFTPFGILAIDDARTLYRMIPLSARIAGVRIEQTESRPAIEDKGKKQLIFPLTADPNAAITSLGAGLGAAEPRVWDPFEFPGVKIGGLHGTVRKDGSRVIVEIKPR